MCVSVSLADDNTRFILLAIVLTGYMLVGAAIFQKLEGDVELKQAAEFWKVYNAFRRSNLITSPQAVQQLHELLYAYSNASSSGIINKRRRWDFSGSFYFVGTIVTTIGYGTTTPQTQLGKAAVIFYGFFGCSGGILFFNLFLERIITFLAWILRSLHLRRLKKRLRKTTLASRRNRTSNNQRTYLPDILDDDDDDDDMDLDHWKPSVYWVMLYLIIFSCSIACFGAIIYSNIEGWSFIDSLYFCFVSFATIGFGDFVSTEKIYYSYNQIYRIGNFIILVLGCCCIYSLLNVTSIVIKQILNCFIIKLHCKNKKMAAPHLPRRKSSVSGFYYPKKRTTKICARDSFKNIDNNNSSISGDTPRININAGLLISMKSFHLQKLRKANYMKQHRNTNITVHKPGAVGPLAIACEKFESTSTSNR
ncbi:hypothetical protein HCN44_005001 [Aphidius gifuensis]|uniref:Potassium channel domain-containing protein n=1 Tax=Aphidius gifuensis TaxID=684658 RepID=A0A835CQW0_APHGI|nr:potassium channel subfamily K member 13-like [Aphidius gifuensis]KAF7992657.1 hypothetical protein HCN44_005001 [Aphidius gifuensis]